MEKTAIHDYQSSTRFCEAFLTSRGWRAMHRPNDDGLFFQDPTGEWIVIINDDLMSLSATDDEIHSFIDSEDFQAIEAKMRDMGALPFACDNCGDEGGEPRERSYRYMYGSDADGNRGEMREDIERGCSKCM